MWDQSKKSTHCPATLQIAIVIPIFVSVVNNRKDAGE
jgi:hypothetical protein